MKDKDRPSRITGWLNGVVYVLFVVLAAAIVISMNFKAGVLQAFFLVFVAAVGAMTLWLKRQLATLPETGDKVQSTPAEAAALLEQSEQTVSALVETSTDWIWAIDLEGVHTYSNPAVQSILGYSPDELIGKLSFDLMHPEDKKEIEKMLPEWTMRKDGWRNQLIRWKHRDGKYRYIESNAEPIMDVDGRLTGFRGVDRDVTDRLQAEKILKESEERIRLLFETVPHAVYECDTDGVITVANSAYSRITGYSNDELVGMHTWDMMAPGEQKQSLPEYLRRLVAEQPEPSSYICRNITKGGRTIDVEVNWDYKRNDQGQVRGFVCILSDITERKEAEEKIESLAKFPAENPNTVLRIRRDGTILYSNRAGLALENAWGYRRGQRLEGQWLELVEKALSLGAVQRGEIKYQGHLFSLVFAPVVESDYVNIYGLDITDLREAEAALCWESSVNKALANLSNVLNKPHYSFEEISDFVLAHARRMTGSKFGFAGYIDEATGYMVCPTMTKEVWKQCRIQGKDIVFKEFNGLLGWVLNERESVLVNSPAEDPRVSGTPEGHIPIERFIGVPSLMGDEVIGMVAVANSEREYASRDLWLVERLAEIYALAIQSNRSQCRLEKHDSQLRDLVSSLGLAQERRERDLAAGLHEEIIDRLRSTRESMALLIEPEGKGQSGAPMSRVRDALRDLVETTHAFASELSCPVLRQSGLAAAVESWLAEDIRKKHGIETVFENDDRCRISDEDVEYFLFEAIKELLANTVKHAQATRVKVSLKRNGDDVEVAVADDGMGFDMAGTRPKAGEGTRYNLFCIGERLRHLGGDMEIDSRFGEGTRVVLRVPTGSGVRK